MVERIITLNNTNYGVWINFFHTMVICLFEGQNIDHLLLSVAHNSSVVPLIIIIITILYPEIKTIFFFFK